MNRIKDLLKNTVILSLGTFFPKFFTILITPILTAQLTQAEYGEYDLICTIVSLLLPAVTLQISSAAFRFLIEKKNNKDETQKIISTIFVFVIGISIITCIIYYFLTFKGLKTNGFIVCFYFISDILLITVQQMMRGLGKNFMYSISTIIRSAFDLAFIIALTGLFGTKNFGLTGVLWSMFTSTFVAFLFIFFKGGIFHYIRISFFDKNTLKELLNYSWPMIPNNMSGWVLRLSDRLVITAVLGIEANAIYAVANKLPTIMSSFQNTFFLAWQENASIASKDNDKDEYYSKMCDWVFRILIGIMAGLLIITPFLWKLLIRGNYEESYIQLPILYFGMLFSCMSSTLGGIYIAHMKTKNIGISTMLAASINLLVDIILIKKIGIWAGSISTLISFLFLFIYRLLNVQKFQKISFHIKKIVLGIILLVIMSLLCWQNNSFLNVLNVVIGLFVIIFFNYDIFIAFFQFLKIRFVNLKKQ